MAGFGAAHRLQAEGLDPVVYDKNPYHGGHTASHRLDGFIFDEGPHVSFTKNQRIQELFAESVGGRFERIQAVITNYWRGHWIKHPAICNLHGLPADLIVSVLRDFMERPAPGERPIRTYEDWLIASYGRTFAQTFPMEYGYKYHTTTADNMSTDWLGPRLYQASLEEVLYGAVTSETPNVHYVQEYRYPADGGFMAYLERFRRRTTLALRHHLVRVDPRARRLFFEHGVVIEYDHLVSSVPLPELIRVMDGVPAEVRDAAQRLACTTVVLVNLGVARPDVSDASWIYFYDREFPFSRVSFPRTMSRSTVPDGASSIQCEIYFSRKYRPLDCPPEALIEPTIEGLQRCGILQPDDQLLLRHAMVVPYANIIFDLDRAPALAVVHGYLEDLGIAWCGRYGEWGYLWTDEAFESGERAAQRVLDDILT
jgi:protoporphyrinogen oxidase